METKKCSKCGVVKEVCEFRKDKTKKDGFYSSCKHCKLIWRRENKELTNASNRRSKNNNKEKIVKYNSEYQKKNRNLINEKVRYRHNTDILFKLSRNVRTRMGVFLKSKNFTKGKNKTKDIIGCTPQELKEHIEKKFKEGMSWNNRDKWHIDHIIPLSSGKTEEEILKLCHYTNLQPLWAKENLEKSDKLSKI
jgi:hypothetical protein